MKILIKFVKRDIWIGLYIAPEKYPLEGGISQKFYVCLIPCLPIIIERRFRRSR